MFHKRKKIVTWLLGGVGLLTAAGAFATTIVQSPQQAAAEAQPPDPSVITVPVEKRVLTDTVVMRGTVRPATTVDVVPTGSASANVSRQLVTKVGVENGDQVESASVLMEVSGRPVFVLKGKIPLYRNLRPGQQGDDIRQFQEALTAAGFSTGTDADGVFGEGTAQAVHSLYRHMGYEPLDAPPVAADESVEKEKKSSLEDAPKFPAAPLETSISSAPMVPVSELVYVPDFPARVDSISARVGSEVGKKILTLSTGKLSVYGVVNATERGLIHPKQDVEIHSEISGVTRSGTVKSVAEDVSTPAEAVKNGAIDAPKSGRQGGAGHIMRVAPDKPLPVALVHQDVRLTIEAASSEHEVLVVPVSAVSASADSKTSVTVHTGEETQRTVPVRVRMSADGYLAVAPVEEGALKAGDEVIVGIEQMPGGAQQ